MDLALVRRCLAGITIVVSGAVTLPALARAQQSTAGAAATTAVADTTSLQMAAQALSSPTAWQALTASSSNPNAVVATAGTTTVTSVDPLETIEA